MSAAFLAVVKIRKNSIMTVTTVHNERVGSIAKAVSDRDNSVNNDYCRFPTL